MEDRRPRLLRRPCPKTKKTHRLEAGATRVLGWTLSPVFAVALGLSNLACIPDNTDTARVTEIQHLRDKLEAQQRVLVTKDEELNAQAASIQELQGLSDERAVERLVHVARVELASLTGGYDDDHDGVHECVKVYLRLVDQDGDTIKAAGSAHARLLDLAKPPETQLVGELKLGLDELRPLWYSRFSTGHYTLKVPWAGGAKRAEHKAITIHARFTDLLSGQTFETQQVVEVAGASAASP